MVETVTEGSKAMGKILPGDIIKSLTINGETKAVTRRFIVIDFMLTLRKGDSMTVEFERNGERKTETFTFNADSDFTTY
jgi:PDZ domain-containing secreted protein